MVDLSTSISLIENICDNSCKNTITHFWLGRRNYSIIWDIQKELHSMIKNNKLDDLVLYLEHDNVYTHFMNEFFLKNKNNFKKK